MSTIDLNSAPPNHKFNVSLVPDETAGERHVRLFKDVVLFLVANAFAVLIAWMCYGTLQSASASAEEKKWAMSVLSAAAGGVIGYLIRK